MLKKILTGSLIVALVGLVVLGAFSFFAPPDGVEAAGQGARGGSTGGGRGNGGAAEGGRQAAPGTLDPAEGKALIEAIYEEYGALATYQKVIDTLGATRPFTQIARSEAQHIEALETLFVRYGVEIPENDLYDRVSTYDSVSEACQAGVEAETADAALYDRLMPLVDQPDILRVFENLRDASLDNHLPAFQACAD